MIHDCDDIITAASDITCTEEVVMLVREVTQIFHSFCQDDRDAINFALFCAEQRVRVIH